MTLSYVAIRIWDDRRLILPTSYFTSKPFQNWTRTHAALLGTAEFDVDWSVPIQATRDEMRRLVEASRLWDGRVCVLQVTDVPAQRGNAPWAHARAMERDTDQARVFGGSIDGFERGTAFVGPEEREQPPR